MVVFVLDIAHDGFHQVLHGDEALGAAVFVHNDGDLQLALDHFSEELAALLGLRDEIDAPHQAGQRDVVVRLLPNVF